MAKINLADGRTIPVVKPNLWDAAAIEKEMGWNRKQYVAQMKLAAMQTAFAIFASLRRAGIPDVTFQGCADLDNIAELFAEPGDPGERDESESEGEETPDPQDSSTPAADPAT